MLNKKRWILPLVVVGIGFWVAAGLLGCGRGTESVLTSLFGTAGNTDPGLLSSPEARVSGAVTKSADTFELNLASVIVSGEAKTITDYNRFQIYVGTSSDATTWKSVQFKLPDTTTNTKIDMAFILDNTGSMSNRIKAIKNSIAAFAQSLEASNADVRFGVVSFGDDNSEQSVQDLGTATEVATFLNLLAGVSGSDWPENPLDSVLYAYRNLSWRTGSQRIFVVIIDTSAHQAGDGTNYTTQTVSSVVASLEGKAVVYAVSPDLSTRSESDVGYIGSGGNWYSSPGTGDVRWLADGYGAGKTATTGARRNTGGKWIELSGSGDIDLTKLGIATTVVKGYKLTFEYTITSGTLYIHVFVDTNGDGKFDSDGVLTYTL